MAYTSIEAVDSFQMPPLVPGTVPKTAGFTFLPVGTILLHDARKWGLYYYAPANVSYLVIDVGKFWRVKPVLGRARVNYVQGVMAQKPCCRED